MGPQDTHNCDQCLLVQMSSSSSDIRQNGWEAWYHRDAPTLLTYIRFRSQLMGCGEYSEDILQDTFLIAFRNISSGHYRAYEGSLYGYLVGIAKNRIRNTIRLQRREPTTIEEDTAVEPAGLNFEDNMYLDDVVVKVYEACMQRPILYQQVVKGLYVECKSSGALAVELNKSSIDVRVIAHRAVRDIKHALERQHSLSLSAEAIRACLEVL